MSSMDPDNGAELSGLSMLDLFRAEVETQAAVLSERLLGLEQNADPSEDLEFLMRAAHSVKGAARMVGVDQAAELAHAMEDYFTGIQNEGVEPASEHVDVLLRAVDLLVRISEVKGTDAPNWLAEHSAEIEESIGGVGALLGSGSQHGLSSTSVDERTPEPVEEVVGEEEVLGGLDELSLMDLFRTEVETHGAVLSDGLLALEGSPGSGAVGEGIDGLMRAAHSIKGAARMVGVEVAASLAHEMENYFVTVQQSQSQVDSAHVDVLLRGVDVLVQISKLPDGDAKTWFSRQQAMLEEVTASVAGLLRQRVPAPAGSSPDGGDSARESAQAGATRVGVEPDLADRRDRADGADRADRADRDRVVRVTAENLDRLMGLAGEALVGTRWLQPFANSLAKLKSAQGDLADLLEDLKSTSEENGSEEMREAVELTQRKLQDCRMVLADRLSELELFSRRSENLSDRLYHEVIDSRMRPFSDGVQGFPRMVRDLARSLGKQVQFIIEGRATRVDRDILAKLEAPLNHLIRNAIDHGIEAPEERVAHGKTAHGTIRLEAGHRAGMLSINLEDDGRGVDLERLREKVRDKNLADAEMIRQLSDSELIDFLFLPGFSTSTEVTEISGRGVGLDVVQSMVQEVGGVLRPSTEPGKGMVFQMQLPLTLSVTRTLLVEVSGETYAFPLGRIDRALRVDRAEVEVVEDRQYIRFNDQNIGLVAAQQILAVEGEARTQEELLVVVLSDRLDRYGLVVDRLLGERDLVVRPLDARLSKTKDISAVAFLDDNSPVLIVDVEDMVRSIDNLVSGGRLRKMAQTADPVGKQLRKRVLVVDDSITVREVERKLLETSGYEVEVAVDGMDGWNAVRSGSYDLVISDVDMPRMNGIDFVQQIKGDPQLQSLPVMIVSYKDREEDRLRGLEAGADYYLTKSSFLR